MPYSSFLPVPVHVVIQIADLSLNKSLVPAFQLELCAFFGMSVGARGSLSGSLAGAVLHFVTLLPCSIAFYSSNLQ